MQSTVIQKAFLILETLCRQDQPFTLARLTEETGLNKPTVHRILQDLVHLGYADRLDGGHYARTRKIEQLSLVGGVQRLHEAAEPIAYQLSQETEETVNVAVLQNRGLQYLIVIESKLPLRRVIESGVTIGFHSTAVGRAIVSQLPEDRWAWLIGDEPLEKLTEHTISDPAALLRILKKARRDGHASEREESDVGVMCLAAPIVVDGEVLGGISLTIPLARVDRAREKGLVKKLQDAAARIAERHERQG